MGQVTRQKCQSRWPRTERSEDVKGMRDRGWRQILEENVRGAVVESLRTQGSGRVFWQGSCPGTHKNIHNRATFNHWPDPDSKSQLTTVTSLLRNTTFLLPFLMAATPEGSKTATGRRGGHDGVRQESSHPPRSPSWDEGRIFTFDWRWKC